MSSSRRKLYLNLKDSITKFFRTRARWLKDTTEKESRFEKPYLDGDYRAMHLRWPSPRWPATRKRDATGFLPKKPGIWTFIFAPGNCSLTSLAGSLRCGDSFVINGWVWETRLQDAVTEFLWTITSSTSKVQLKQTPSLGGVSCWIEGTIDKDFDGTVVICASVSLHGTVIDEFAVANPFSDKRILGWDVALGLPKIYLKESKGGTYNCGCVEVKVDCCDKSTTIAWNDPGSDDTIARSGTATIAITGSSTPFTWEITEGTGFTLDYSTTTGLSNILRADATACGSATITVTGCDGVSVTGYVRCNEASSWQYQDTGCIVNTTGWLDAADGDCNLYFGGEFIVGKYKQLNTVHFKTAANEAECNSVGIPIFGDPPGTNPCLCLAAHFNVCWFHYGTGCNYWGFLHHYSRTYYEWKCT